MTSDDLHEDPVTFTDIVYDTADRIATITLNRPNVLNALSPHMISELRLAYAAAEADEAVWTIVVTGAGRAFCTGADVGEITPDGRVVYEEPYLSTYPQWEAPQEGTPPFRSMAKPIIVAVNGLCCGAGLDWVTTGDIVIASRPRRRSSTRMCRSGSHRAVRWCGSPGYCRLGSRCGSRSPGGTSA